MTFKLKKCSVIATQSTFWVKRLHFDVCILRRRHLVPCTTWNIRRRCQGYALSRAFGLCTIDYFLLFWGSGTNLKIIKGRQMNKFWNKLQWTKDEERLETKANFLSIFSFAKPYGTVRTRDQCMRQTSWLFVSPGTGFRQFSTSRILE